MTISQPPPNVCERGDPGISRRSFLAGAGTLILPCWAAARPAKTWQIGYLELGMPDDARLLEAFVEGLRALGYIEGQNVVIVRRNAEGRFETLDALAEEIVHLKVDVIVTPTTPASRAAQQATTSIPVVFTIVSDLWLADLSPVSPIQAATSRV